MPCQYSPQCGGCDLQHLEYKTQLENKKKQISKLLNFQNTEILSGPECNYRNRMDFLFFPGGIGLRDKNNRKIIDIEDCPIANSRINELLKEIRESEYFTEYSQECSFAVIRASSKDYSISFVLRPNLKNKEEIIEKVREFSKKINAKNILVTFPEKVEDSTSSDYLIIKGKDYLEEEFLNLNFRYPTQGFFQNNPSVAEMMLKYVKELLSKYSIREAHLLDLYGGVGTFGVTNYKEFRKITIIESFPPAIEMAKENIKLNQVKNAEAFALDAQQLRKVKLSAPLYVITDPPRSGMDEKVIVLLKELQPEAIIYISCNPQQLAKDVLKFKKCKLKSVALFDLFPQTKHFEVIAELAKISPTLK